MGRLISYSIIYSAILTGGGALVAFLVFIFAGPFNIMVLGVSDKDALIINAGLSLLFFIQHSVMIRKPFREKIGRFLPEAYFSAVFAIASGIVLLIVILFWQKTVYSFADADGVFYWVLRLLFLVAVGGFYWGSSALGFFDPFGRRAIKKHLRSSKSEPMPFTVKGPYRWVRHPLYFFTLVMIWSCPHLTADRLLFNVLWTIWLVVGSIFEERDLVSAFGNEYREHQLKVPMLIPIKWIK
jgi:protein-S-isoprenylcysteine O-methyltransferase Ste14